MKIKSKIIYKKKKKNVFQLNTRHQLRFNVLTIFFWCRNSCFVRSHCKETKKKKHIIFAIRDAVVNLYIFSKKKKRLFTNETRQTMGNII